MFASRVQHACITIYIYILLYVLLNVMSRVGRLKHRQRLESCRKIRNFAGQESYRASMLLPELMAAFCTVLRKRKYILYTTADRPGSSEVTS